MDYSYGVSEGALVRRDSEYEEPPAVLWPNGEWHVLTDMESWVESRPLTAQEAQGEFPDADLAAEVTFDPEYASPDLPPEAA